MPFRDDLKAAQQRVAELGERVKELEAELARMREREQAEGPERLERQEQIRDLEARLGQATRHLVNASPRPAPRARAAWVLVALIVLGAAGALLSWKRSRPAPHVPPPGPTIQECSIETSPEGALVFATNVLGRPEAVVGVTPLSLEQPVVDKTILLSKQGYELATSKLPTRPMPMPGVGPGPSSCIVRTTLVPLPLPPADQSGTVHVESEPTYSTIEVDGRKTCVTPCDLHLAAQRAYKLVVDASDLDHLQDERTVSVEAGQSMTLHVRHQRLDELMAVPPPPSASADAGRRAPSGR